MQEIPEADPEFYSQQVTRARRFYFGKKASNFGSELDVAGGGWELVAKNYSIDRKTFPWLSFEFIAGGRGLLQMVGESYELRRGCFFAYGPGITHRIETDPKELLSKYYLNFSGGEAEHRISAIDMAVGSFRTMKNGEEIESLFESIIDEGLSRGPHAPEIVALQLRILLLKIGQGSEPGGVGECRARQTLQRCLVYADQHFLSIHTAQELASACHVSLAHMTRSFSRFGYGAPYRYLTRRKMLHAALLLDSGRFLVREVADRLAMDPFQFSRSFKRVHGISPSAFANRHGLNRAGWGFPEQG